MTRQHDILFIIMAYRRRGEGHVYVVILSIILYVSSVSVGRRILKGHLSNKYLRGWRLFNIVVGMATLHTFTRWEALAHAHTARTTKNDAAGDVRPGVKSER